jgi:hypothetical protein
LAISQNPNVICFLRSLFAEVKPKRVLEIGTSHGGLTLMMRDLLDEMGLDDSRIMTYDIYEQVFLKPLVEGRNVDVKTESMFCDEYKRFKDENIKKTIAEYIQKEGASIVVCDGGNKVSEFRLLADAIKPNDIIMAHDYAPDSEYFENKMRDKVWNWHEIRDSDISETCDRCGLAPYMKEDALKVAWACFKKNR